jgi:hypothetical protein
MRGRSAPRWTTVLVAVASAWLAMAAIALETTGAVFSRTTANGGNTFQALGTFPCTAPGTVTLTSVADAAVRQNNANANYGTQTTTDVQSRNGSRNRRTLVRFTLPAIPNRCSVTAATLRLNTTTLVAGRTYQAFRLNGAWTETGVTWNTQPATTGPATTTVTAAGWIQWTVTTQVQSMYSGGNNGFLVRDQTEDDPSSVLNQYSSREGANDPQLVVTFG